MILVDMYGTVLYGRVLVLTYLTPCSANGRLIVCLQMSLKLYIDLL